MKRLLFLSLLVFAVSCSNRQESEVIKVEYNLVTGADILRSDMIKSIDMIRLQSEDAPMVGERLTSINIHNDTIYYFDPYDNKQLLLYDMEGNFLNAIGKVGNGPEEYIDALNFFLNDDGTVSMYSLSSQAEYIYNKRGEFVNKINYELRPYQLIKDKGRIYYYFGEGGVREDKLVISDENQDIVAEYLPNRDIISMTIGAPVFSKHRDNLYLCEPYGTDILMLDGDKEPQLKYSFDFGDYNMPEEFYTGGFEKSFEIIGQNPFTIKDLFVESDSYSLLSVIVTDISKNESFCLYGVHDKAKKSWRWFKLDVPVQEDVAKSRDYLFVSGGMKYVDNKYLYLVADPLLLKEAGLEDIIPEISDLKDDDNTVILKCRL